MNCLNCGCSEKDHPIDHILSQRYGETTRGACLACNECSLYDDEEYYENDCEG